MLTTQCCLTLVGLIVVLSTICETSMCPGKYQSISKVKNREIFLIGLNKFSDQPIEVVYENNGQTVVMTYKYENTPASIESGPFGDEIYNLEFMYYHWLNASEETQDTDAVFPAELHAVFVNQAFANYQEAIKKNLAVVVVAFKHWIVPDDHFYRMEPFYDPIDKIHNPNNKFGVLPPRTPYLHNILNIAREYDMYVGKSVFGTSSTCGGDVIWLDYGEATKIKRKDIAMFQKLMSSDSLPLMSKVQQFSSPNTLVYHTEDPYTFRENNMTVKNFEGFEFVFDSAHISFIGYEKILLIMLIVLILTV